MCKGTQDIGSLAKFLNRDRDTITQSINKLLIPQYYIYVAKEEKSPNKKKRRKIFIPTDKGKYYAIGFLDLTWDDIFSLNDLEGRALFEKLKETVTDVNEFNNLAKYSAQKCVEYNFFDKGMFVLKSPTDMIEMGIAKGRAEAEIGLRTDSNTYFQSLGQNGLKKLGMASFRYAVKQLIENRPNENDEIVKLLED